MTETRPFLTAEWQYLLMLNYEVDPAVLAPLVPAGTELDLWQGRALVSMVGFLFNRTRVLGIPVPFHTHFEEINLRFYVRKPAAVDPEGVERGVVFVKEIVPLPWVALIARLAYHENYVALPMGHTVEEKNGELCTDGLVEYAWRHRGRLNRLGGLANGEPRLVEAGSEEAFIAEHYWGYTYLGKKRTGTYRVAHPTWRVWPVLQPYLLCDVKAMYGAAFEPFLRRRPHSAFLAEGSAVAVYPGKEIHAKQGSKQA